MHNFPRMMFGINGSTVLPSFCIHSWEVHEPKANVVFQWLKTKHLDAVTYTIILHGSDRLLTLTSFSAQHFPYLPLSQPSKTFDRNFITVLKHCFCPLSKMYAKLNDCSVYGQMEYGEFRTQSIFAVCEIPSWRESRTVRNSLTRGESRTVRDSLQEGISHKLLTVCEFKEVVC